MILLAFGEAAASDCTLPVTLDPTCMPNAFPLKMVVALTAAVAAKNWRRGRMSFRSSRISTSVPVASVDARSVDESPGGASRQASTFGIIVPLSMVHGDWVERYALQEVAASSGAVDTEFPFAVDFGVAKAVMNPRTP